VADALGTFLVEILPPECNTKGNLSVLKDLCSIGFSILKNGSTGNQVKFQSVFRFLTAFVRDHGDFVENRTREAIIAQTPAEEGKSEIVVLLTDLLLAAVDEFQVASLTTSAFDSNKEQGQGQAAYESKSAPAKKGEAHVGEEICEMLSLFTTCVERCPSFFFQLPSAPGLEGQQDLLHRKATESAIAFLNVSDTQTSTHAMAYLEALVSPIVTLI